MLVSHRKKFIFLKTRKTAGTSVEIYLEPYCLPPVEPFVATHRRQESVTPAGIVGYRGPNNDASQYSNHMTAKALKPLVGDDVWNSYLKSVAFGTRSTEWCRCFGSDSLKTSGTA